MVRVMPNTACQVGETAAALCPGPHALEEDTTLVLDLFRALGECVAVQESQMDGVWWSQLSPVPSLCVACAHVITFT